MSIYASIMVSLLCRITSMRSEVTSVMPRLSAVIPTYNRSDLLTECLDALLGQTATNVEVIVADNASPSNIQKIVNRRYGTRIKTVRLDRNYFFCGAANRGAEIATGDLL